MTRIVLAACASLSFMSIALAGPNGEYYEGDDPNPAPLKYTDEVLLATLKQELARNKVTTIKNLTTGASDVAAFSRTEKVALLYLNGAKPGAEMDVVVEENGKYVAVQTYWDGATMTFKAGAPRASLYGKASSKEEIQKKYGVGAFVDSGSIWDEASLYIVETALATLSKDELKALAGIPFHRIPKDPSNKSARGTVIGMYVPERAQVELYDHALDADKRKFFGTVDKPMPLSSQTMVHELGHVVSRAGALARRRQAIEAKKDYDEVNAKLIEGKKQYDADKATYTKTRDQALGKSLQERGVGFKTMMADMTEKRKRFEVISAQMVQDEKKGSALEQAFDKKLPFKNAPTLYGRTSPGESFAESFSLHKLDPAALDRAAPGVSAWFESPEYTALIAAK